MKDGNGQANGEIITIGRHGLRKMRYDESTEAVEIDVIHAANQWNEAIERFLDDKGEIKKEERAAYYDQAVQFARDMLKVPAEVNITIASALHFLKVITDEGDALKPFFEPKSSAASSSAEKPEVIYST